MEEIKLVIVGDGAVGKSCLLIAYNTNSFPSEYVPTVFDNYSSNILVEGKPYNIGFWDTAGQEDYDSLRPLSYPYTDIFLLAFSISEKDSLEHIKYKWIQEIKYHCPDVPCLLVGCKTDLRASDSDDAGGKEVRCYSRNQALKVADSLGMQYVETSALTQTGLTECFDLAFRLAVNGKKKASPKKSWFHLGKNKTKKEVPIPPVMPPAGKAPWVEVTTSTFADDWYKALQDPQFYDVTFVVEGERQLHAHKIVLSSASKFFANVLGVVAGNKTSQQRQMDAIDSFSRQDLNQGRVGGIASVHEDADPKKPLCRQVATVVLSEDISAKTFLRVLEFIYTGDPKLPDDFSKEDLSELSRVAALFKLSQLQTICRNLETEQDFLNPSIGTFLNDEIGAVMKADFFNQPDYADVIFNVKGSSDYAHRVVLACRSVVMAAMFSGNFSEGNDQAVVKVDIPHVEVDTFLAVLEYWYTDHAPIESGDGVGILVTADEYCAPRLQNLCELYITKEVDRHCINQIEKSKIDVIGLLNTAETYNCKQLTKWCLFFISSNFLAFEKRAEFPKLKAHHREHVFEHRWPPLSYLEEVAEFEKKMEAAGSDKCVVM